MKYVYLRQELGTTKFHALMYTSPSHTKFSSYWNETLSIDIKTHQPHIERKIIKENDVITMINSLYNKIKEREKKIKC